MRKLLVAALLVLALFAAQSWGARERIGRLVLAAGLPSTAAGLIGDPDWKGVALYSAQHWSEAADAFRASGASESAYNLGNALAQAHRYAEALAAYEEALTRNPQDDDARANQELIAMLVKAETAHSGTQVTGSADAVATQRSDNDHHASAGENARSSGREGMAGSQLTATDAGAAGGGVKRSSTVIRSSSGSVRKQTGGSATNYGGLGPGGGAQRTLLEDPIRMGKSIEARAVQADARWLESLPDDPGSFLKLRLLAEHNRRVAAGIAPPITGDPW